ncbi:hypothetical protein FKW77_005549 [Venturia effusa]|uniref:DUF1365 domain-containing protein n=1 Tax=Venturia effusa TaxID=50376 RepID=A0A517L9C3_9PEZI|nr:hypothetical protein FKW77_005549 [Venturia effusa]
MSPKNNTVLSALGVQSVLTTYVSEYATLLSLPTFAIWFIFWKLRDRKDPTRKQDVIILAAFLCWRCLSIVQPFATLSISKFGDYTNALLFSVAVVVTVGAGLAIIQILSQHHQPRKHNTKGDHPWILPSRTTHTRMFPKKHSFAYSYLQVAVPVGFEGRCGSLISVGAVKKKGWLHVQGSDYLDRNSSETTLEGKLSEYLQTQGVQRVDWHHAYLITAPRILGYSFNPVSFWYLYTKDNRLSMMVLEVNNTFDERRMYLLRSALAEEVGGAEIQAGRTQKFTNTWAKDFHVSPFNSRKGFYSLAASDAFSAPNSPPAFDNNIVMKSSKEHVKIIARVFSDGEPIDPNTVGLWSATRFLMRWGWVGFFTFPRILKEAFNLFFRRKLHVWLRPEVLPTSLGRLATSLELSLEPFFVAYLHYLVHHSDADLDLIYITPTSGNKQMHIASRNGFGTDQNRRTLEIRILSPAFFSRFVHYAHTSEAFDREGLFTDDKNRTILVSRPELLTLLLKSERDSSFMKTYLSPLDRLRWCAHRKARCPPSSPTYSSIQQYNNVSKVKDVRMKAFSPMDRLVQRSGHAWCYRRQCMRLFLSQRFALGFTPLIDLVDLSFRVVLIHLAVSSTLANSYVSLVPSLAMFVLPSCVHLYAYIKGTD